MQRGLFWQIFGLSDFLETKVVPVFSSKIYRESLVPQNGCSEKQEEIPCLLNEVVIQKVVKK